MRGHAVKVIRLSDNLLDPKEWVAEIRTTNGKTEWAVQFVGRDEGRDAVWRHSPSVASARKAVAAAVKARKGEG